VSTELKVHLDHLIRRQSIRYVPTETSDRQKLRLPNGRAGQEDRAVRYSDIRGNEWFPRLRKPDFQRETNAWTPDDCLVFLDSVVRGRIIPSIILWANDENSLIYVLDGAHRLSVLRAWMVDDWGDKAGDYYKRRDMDTIREAARISRQLITQKIGYFSDYAQAGEEIMAISEQGKAPKQVLGIQRFEQGTFYNRAVGGFLTMAVQWERGDYSSAEQSFLRINRRGQALDPWEATLIEYRHSSYARSIMSIANGGESGHYWPEPSDEEEIEEETAQLVSGFAEKAAAIYERLFIPPFHLPITDLNVPLMVAPAYFQKHKYLLEVMPLIIKREIAITEENQVAIMKQDDRANAQTVIKNADYILTAMDEGLEHLISPSHSSKSLSLVPLFYWYNQKGQHTRGLLYGFIYWLLSGTTTDILQRKQVFCANRGHMEHFLFYLKQEIGGLQQRWGAGLKATNKAAGFFQSLLEVINRSLEPDPLNLEEAVLQVLREYGNIPNRGSKAKISRNFSGTDRTFINIREMFENSVRCHICGGVINLSYGGLQYDHTEDYALTGLTDPETGKPTHPFCNRHKHPIMDHQKSIKRISLPAFGVVDEVEISSKQLALPLEFWGVEDFPE
jgi:hypothetical protein